MVSLLPCGVAGSPLGVQGGARAPPCSPGQPSFHTHTHPHLDPDTTPSYYTLAFPCGLDLPQGATTLSVQVTTEDADCMILPSMSPDQDITLKSMNCKNTCATQKLAVRVRYLVDNVAEEDTFNITDAAGERAKVCGHRDSSLKTSRQASEIAALRHHVADMSANLGSLTQAVTILNNKVNQLEIKLKRTSTRHLYHKIKTILDWELKHRRPQD